MACLLFAAIYCNAFIDMPERFRSSCVTTAQLTCQCILDCRGPHRGEDGGYGAFLDLFFWHRFGAHAGRDDMWLFKLTAKTIVDGEQYTKICLICIVDQLIPIIGLQAARGSASYSAGYFMIRNTGKVTTAYRRAGLILKQLRFFTRHLGSTFPLGVV